MMGDGRRQTQGPAGSGKTDATVGAAGTGGPATLHKTALVKLTADDADVRMSAVGCLATDHADLKMSAAALMYARGPVALRFSSANLLLAGDDVHVQYGGSQMVAANGDVKLTTALAGAVVSREAHVEHGVVGMLVAGKVELGDGARVILKPAGAAALGAGFAGGLLLAFAFLWRLLARGIKRRGSRPDSARAAADD